MSTFFLLSKSERYYYDAAAISEPATGDTHLRVSRAVAEEATAARARGERYDVAVTSPKALQHPDSKSRVKNNASYAGSICLPVDRRNSRSVWSIATQSYAGSHFATFPDELPRRCILAGSAAGDTVLDPFGGSGTTAAVAIGNGRNAVLCEINPTYAALARERIGPLLVDAEPATA